MKLNCGCQPEPPPEPIERTQKRRREPGQEENRERREQPPGRARPTLPKPCYPQKREYYGKNITESAIG